MPRRFVPNVLVAALLACSASPEPDAPSDPDPCMTQCMNGRVVGRLNSGGASDYDGCRSRCSAGSDAVVAHEPATTASVAPDAPTASNSVSAPAPSPPKAKATFPPPDIAPPHARSQKKGDGVWRALGDAARGERVDGTVVTTVLHPHPISRFESVVVAAIDLSRLALRFSPGTDDPNLELLPAGHTAGLIPEARHDALVAVFNGGFAPRHGRWGMMLDGAVLVPPREDACTLAILRDGSVQLRPWPELAAEAAPLEAYRQTPPCLLTGGELHAHLAAGNERAWGGFDPDRPTRRRSAFGLDATGTIGYYALGIEVGPKNLALALKYAGARSAAQLDINWSWTKFLVFGHGDKLLVTSSLIPKMVHSRNGYVDRKAFRDFFYLVRR